MTKLEELEKRLSLLEEKAEAARVAGASEQKKEAIEEKKAEVKEKINEVEKELTKDDFVPQSTEKVKAECSNCNTVFEFAETDKPQKCPGCGEALNW